MNAPVTVKIDPALAAEAIRIAELNGVSLDRLVEAVLQRHLELVGRANEMMICPDDLRTEFTLRRAPDEAEDEYEERRRLLLG